MEALRVWGAREVCHKGSERGLPQGEPVSGWVSCPVQSSPVQSSPEQSVLGPRSQVRGPGSKPDLSCPVCPACPPPVPLLSVKSGLGVQSSPEQSVGPRSQVPGPRSQVPGPRSQVPGPSQALPCPACPPPVPLLSVKSGLGVQSSPEQSVGPRSQVPSPRAYRVQRVHHRSVWVSSPVQSSLARSVGPRSQVPGPRSQVPSLRPYRALPCRVCPPPVALLAVRSGLGVQSSPVQPRAVGRS